jgi:enoyl-CoA hydratase
MNYETLLVEIADSIATVTLNRPKVLNAMNAPMLRELEALFTSFADDPAVRVILLRGAGGKAFAAGADIAELQTATTADQGEQLARRAQRVLRRIETIGKPVIACIDGFALGGGCELALACTVRLGTANARFGQPELKLGVIPGWGGTQRLPRLIGRSAALKLILTGQIIPAEEALRIGLLDEVVAGDTETALLPRARELGSHMAAMPRLAVAAAVQSVNEGADLPLDEALALEASIFGRLCGTADKAEGTRAFLEKRPPSFTGL